MAQHTETVEPPLANPSKGTKPSKFDPDENSGIKPAQYIVPGTPVVLPSTPTPLPGSVINSGGVPGVVTVGESVPYEVLPAPHVTLNIEGSNDAPTGQAVTYKLVVRNVSRAKAHNVVLRVTPPKTADLVKVDPPATAKTEAENRWEWKMLEPGQTQTVDVACTPKPGATEVKLLARVQFDFGRGMITNISPPSIKISKEAPTTMVLGDTVTQRIVVKNTGKVTIRDINISEVLDKSLEYDTRVIGRGTVDARPVGKGNFNNGQGAWTIGRLAPGETQTLEYRVKGKKLGTTKSIINVQFPGSQPTMTEHEVDVRSAVLEMKAEGPAEERGIVGQPVAYRIVVTNRGNADLFNVSVRCLFPPEMRVTRATQNGQPYRDAVQWTFRELKPGQSQEVTVALSTSTPGTRTIRFSAFADKGTEQKSELKTEFGGLSNLDWDINAPGTVAAGKKMTYTVTVTNKGTATAKRIQLRLDLPANVDFVDTAPPAAKGTGANSRQLIFAPQDLAVGKKTTFTIEVKARAPGEARAYFQLYDPEYSREPKEESSITQITDTNNRSPNGPPPRVIDPTKVGYPPAP